MNRIAAVLMSALLVPVAAVAQDWKTYPYPDAGFSVQFPGPPTVERAPSGRRRALRCR